MKCLRSKKRKSALLITTRVVEKRRLRKLTCGRWALAVGAVRLGPEALPRPAPALPLHSAVTVALYICSLINICMYVYTHTHAHTLTRTHTHAHKYIHTYTYTCVCVCVCVYVCMCVCVCVRVCVHAYINIIMYKYNNI